MRLRDRARRAQRGSMVLVILFFMVVGGMLAAALVSVVGTQTASSALDLHLICQITFTKTMISGSRRIFW